LTTTNFVAHISPACRQTGSWFWGQVSAELVDSMGMHACMEQQIALLDWLVEKVVRLGMHGAELR
jgi:hypothetical protein